MKRVAELPIGAVNGNILCGDTDHDSLNEMIFLQLVWYDPTSWQIWEGRAANRNKYDLAYRDTFSTYPYPPEVFPGNLYPENIGNLDGDSLTDLLGFNIQGVTENESHNCVCVMEGPTRYSYPESVAWWYTFPPTNTGNEVGCPAYGDFNNDGRTDIVCQDDWDVFTHVFKNTGDDQYDLVWRSCTLYYMLGKYAVGDFDADGKTEFVTADYFVGGIWVFKNAGGDSYVVIRADSVGISNTDDLFVGNNIDGSHDPVFFGVPANYDGWYSTFYLYMWRWNGSRYERTLIDTARCEVGWGALNVSRCGDVDGDGIDEIVWSAGRDVFILKQTAPGRFQRIWQWHNPSQDEYGVVSLVNICDLNRNGYNEVVLSGDFAGLPGGYPRDRTYVYEMAAVRVLSPRGGKALRGGDTTVIRWSVFSPPRCGSVSLFLRTDTTWSLDTIAHGLAPTETAYSWVVPDVVAESCYVVAMAYGPGWQYDENETAFSIVSTGVSAGKSPPIHETKLTGSLPNPLCGPARVRYQLKSKTPVRLAVRDVTGRVVSTLASGVKASGVYDVALDPRTMAQGVYFLSFDTPDHHETRKVVAAW